MINVNELTKIPMECTLPEFVGTTVLDTIGLVPRRGASLLSQMQLKKPYKKSRYLKFPHRRRRADQHRRRGSKINKYGKSSIQLPRDTKAGAVMRNFIILGGENVSDRTTHDRDRAEIYGKICRGAISQ